MHRRLPPPSPSRQLPGHFLHLGRQRRNLLSITSLSIHGGCTSLCLLCFRGACCGLGDSAHSHCHLLLPHILSYLIRLVFLFLAERSERVFRPPFPFLMSKRNDEMRVEQSRSIGYHEHEARARGRRFFTDCYETASHVRAMTVYEPRLLPSFFTATSKTEYLLSLPYLFISKLAS